MTPHHTTRALAALLLVLAAAGCGNQSVKDGDALFRQGRYEEAATAYRRAEVEEPRDREVAQKRQDAEREAAMARFQRGLERAQAGDVVASVAELEAACRLDPWLPKAKEELGKQRAALARARESLSRARKLLEGGDALAALDAIGPAKALVAADATAADTWSRAHAQAAQQLRAQAARRLDAGDADGANQDLARAKRLDAEAQAVARSGGRPAMPEDPARPGGGKPPLAAGGKSAGTGTGTSGGGGDLEGYARAAAEVQRLTKALPKRRPGAGIAKAEDYALSEDDVLVLAKAIDEAAAAKPPAEKTPQWLAHGRICLRMARETAALRRVITARATVLAGDLLGGWLELDAARRVDPEILSSHEAEADVLVVRAAVARRLLELARADLAAGRGRLGRLRARQAEEIGTKDSAAEAARVIESASSLARGRVIVLMPFLDYTSGGDPLAERFHERLRARLSLSSAAPTLEYATWMKERGQGPRPDPVALVKGDLLRLEVRDSRDAAGVADARVAAEKRRVEEARRRRDAAPGGPSRERAQAALDDAERSLARAERERAAAGVAATRTARSGSGAVAPGDLPITATLEVQYQLHDVPSGKDLFAEHVVTTAEGRAADREHVVKKLLDDAVEPIAAAVEARLFDVQASVKSALAKDPLAQLDARIAALEGKKGAPDAGAAAAVLEATGYSYAERRTIPAQLRLE